MAQLAEFLDGDPQPTLQRIGEEMRAAADDQNYEAAVQAFFVRRGRVVGRKGWTVHRVEDLTTTSCSRRSCSSCTKSAPTTSHRSCCCPSSRPMRTRSSELLRELRGTRVEFRVPQRGEKRALLETVRDNAREAFQRHRPKRAQDFNARSQALQELRKALGLDEAPLRIECLDADADSSTSRSSQYSTSRRAPSVGRLIASASTISTCHTGV